MVVTGKNRVTKIDHRDQRQTQWVDRSILLSLLVMAKLPDFVDTVKDGMNAMKYRWMFTQLVLMVVKMQGSVQGMQAAGAEAFE